MSCFYNVEAIPEVIGPLCQLSAKQFHQFYAPNFPMALHNIHSLVPIYSNSLLKALIDSLSTTPTGSEFQIIISLKVKTKLFLTFTWYLFAIL